MSRRVVRSRPRRSRAELGLLARVARLLSRHPLTVGVMAFVATLLLAVPVLTMAPTEQASQEPGGPAFDAREVLDRRLAPEVATEFFLVEAATGRLLEPASLRELHERLEQLRSGPATAPLLVEVYDPMLDLRRLGGLTLTDAVEAALSAQGSAGLAAASDAAVADTVDAIVGQVGPVALGLDQDAEVAADGSWRATGLALPLALDNAALGGGSGGARIGGDTSQREEALRDVRDVLRGGAAGERVSRADAGALQAHAVAADVNLTSAEQGEAAGPFIAVAVLLTLLLVGATFRSVWTVAVVGSGIAALMIWLQGWSNLLGLRQDQILATIVPIALLAFGIDFAFHAIGRLEEERASGRPPRGALAVGLTGVGGALLLVLASDVAAFLSNTVSGIESIVQFGIAAALGLGVAFLLLGVVAPTVLAGIAERVDPPPAGRLAGLWRAVASVAIAGLTTTSVLGTVFLDPVVGIAVFVLLVLLAVVLPTWLAARRHAQVLAGTRPARRPAHQRGHHPEVLAAGLGAGLAGIARRGAVILPAVAVVTVVAVVGATQVETRFDVRDFFASDTDFVVALDALDRIVGENGGEPTQIVVTADLADPEVLARLGATVDDLSALDTEVFATGSDGRTLVDGGVVDVVRYATLTPATRARVEAASGTALVDADGNGLPEDADAVAAILDLAAERGLGPTDGQLVWTPARVSAVLDRSPGADATVLTLQLPGSREVAAIAEAQAALEPELDELRAGLQRDDPAATVTLAGAPVIRQLTLDAISRALLLSLPIAVLACLAVATVAMRSVRTAVIAIVPILLVVPWLYGTMWAMGYAVNLVTGTIGAISIGIGIDFAIHLVARFREEHARLGDRDLAMRATGAGTGVALVASAVSSIAGFVVLAFAPMPLFAAYGVLTALMIAMALTATLLVLPPLLRLSTRDLPGPPPSHHESPAAARA